MANWNCIGGNGQCYSMCGFYTADCGVDSCTCETPMGIQDCATLPLNDCDGCERLIQDGCCGRC